MLSLPYPVYVEYIDQITREPRHKTVFELATVFVPSPQHDLNGKRVHALLQITNFGTVHSLISVNLYSLLFRISCIPKGHPSTGSSAAT